MKNVHYLLTLSRGQTQIFNITIMGLSFPSTFVKCRSKKCQNKLFVSLKILYIHLSMVIFKWVLRLSYAVQ